MIRAPLVLFIVFYLFSSSVPAAADAALERGTAITDPLALRELDRGRFGLGRMLEPARSADLPLSNAQLFALSSMMPVQPAIDGEFDRYTARHQAALAKETIGVGDGFDFQLFDRTRLYSADTRFVLSGIVNRMDRTYLDEIGCGEVRLIYRLARTASAFEENAQRLPMTLNLVLRTKGDHASGIACAEIARRWLASGRESATGVDLAARLLAKDGPLDLIEPENLELIEINLQIAHAPKSAVRDFRTDYLLKVFRYDTSTKLFEETPLENQIDRDRILADENLKRDFKAWLLHPRHFAQLDDGTLLLPEQFVAKGAITTTPAGFVPSSLQPTFGLTEGEGANAVFTRSDIVTAFKKAASNGETPLQNIRSVGGFARRLNDLTCSGCHQTRGIGGFHFPGVDWMAAKPSNSTVVPGSPHFFGDQVRRRDILDALASGKKPDYSRGFASRPQLRGNDELAGTGYSDGWGAHCYRQRGRATGIDASFRAWTCAKGLACETTGENSLGMCFVKSR